MGARHWSELGLKARSTSTSTRHNERLGLPWGFHPSRPLIIFPGSALPFLRMVPASLRRHSLWPFVLRRRASEASAPRLPDLPPSVCHLSAISTLRLFRTFSSVALSSRRSAPTCVFASRRERSDSSPRYLSLHDGEPSLQLGAVALLLGVSRIAARFASGSVLVFGAPAACATTTPSTRLRSFRVQISPSAYRIELEPSTSGFSLGPFPSFGLRRPSFRVLGSCSRGRVNDLDPSLPKAPHRLSPPSRLQAPPSAVIGFLSPRHRPACAFLCRGGSPPLTPSALARCSRKRLTCVGFQGLRPSVGDQDVHHSHSPNVHQGTPRPGHCQRTSCSFLGCRGAAFRNLFPTTNFACNLWNRKKFSRLWKGLRKHLRKCCARRCRSLGDCRRDRNEAS